MTSSIADLRKSYERAELNEDASHAAPLQQFDQWLKEAIASEVPEPNAMTVATVGRTLSRMPVATMTCGGPRWSGPVCRMSGSTTPEGLPSPTWRP